jgi:hypothetical protein
MISFNNIGNMGRLGNQMFQYSALRGISEHKRYLYSFPPNTELSKCFKISQSNPNQNTHIVKVNKFEFDQDFFNNCPDDVDLIGYFQTEKYFKHIENKIRQDFTFYDRISNICKTYINQIFPTGVISLHIRRSDYLKDKNFIVLDMEYYKKALEILNKDVPVLVFSDDVDWCKNYFTDNRFTVSMTNNPHMDLCLMSMCDYHIIANSSFSWWGSWLAKSKKTIAPKDWFCGDFGNWNTEDLYLQKWITI